MTKKQFFGLASTAKDAKEGIILRCVGMVIVVPLVSAFAISMYPPNQYLALKILTPIFLVAGYVYGILMEYRNYKELKRKEAEEKEKNIASSMDDFYKLMTNNKKKR